MALTYDHAAGTVRGSQKQIVQLRARLARLTDSSRIPAELADAGVSPMVQAEDVVLDGMRSALAAPILTVVLTNAGPGGIQRHVIDAGANAVCARWSTSGADLAELAASPFPVLPELLTRLVRFQPGREPQPGSQALLVAPEAMADLAAESSQTRMAAWSGLREELGDRIDPGEADGSWQVVEARCAWTAAEDGRPVEDIAVYLRAGDAYFVLLEQDDSFELVPVPSVTAWEVLIHVLPGADEVKDPRKD